VPECKPKCPVTNCKNNVLVLSYFIKNLHCHIKCLLFSEYVIRRRREYIESRAVRTLEAGLQ